MSRRIRNREIKRLMGMTHYHSNTRIMTRRGCLVQVRPSKRQSKANKRDSDKILAWVRLIELARKQQGKEARGNGE